MIRSSLVVISVVCLCPGARAGAPDGLADRIWEITDTVLERHIDPPTRSQMILDGLKDVYRLAAGRPAVPAGLEGRLSAVSSPEQLAPVLDELWSNVPADRLATLDREVGVERLLIDTMLGAVPGGARRLSAQDVKVEEQFAGNRYVGLHIALGMNGELKRMAIQEVLEGGPAHRAGVKDGDLLEEIDGATTENMHVKEAVDRLRGPEGSTVTIRVRQPSSTESRVLTIARGVLPRTTAKGFRNRPDGSIDVLISGPERIGYVKIEQILGSTPHELRTLSKRLEEEGAAALILDLRSAEQADLHSTVLLADCLLDTGTIGRVRSVDRVETFQAEPGALFRGRPLVVLVDHGSAAIARWLAAALQDNHRALVVGPPNSGFAPATGVPRRKPLFPRGAEPTVRSVVPLGDSGLSIEMATGRLERGDGRPLAAAGRDEKGALVPDIIATGVIPDGERGPESDPLVRGDAILAVAVRRLRASLPIID
jgi:carboxyl-terminal processing protease